jgi:hypothetical protein
VTDYIPTLCRLPATGQMFTEYIRHPTLWCQASWKVSTLICFHHGVLAVATYTPECPPPRMRKNFLLVPTVVNLDMFLTMDPLYCPGYAMQECCVSIETNCHNLCSCAPTHYGAHLMHVHAVKHLVRLLSPSSPSTCRPRISAVMQMSADRGLWLQCQIFQMWFTLWVLIP